MSLELIQAPIRCDTNNALTPMSCTEWMVTVFSAAIQFIRHRFPNRMVIGRHFSIFFNAFCAEMRRSG